MNTCGSCIYRDENGYCINEKLTESWMSTRTDPSYSDYLIYSYNEDGSFWVGPDFGCIHYIRKKADIL